MHNLLINYPVYFPKQKNDELYTLNEFLTHNSDQLPMIVNITSLNNHGRSMKQLLSKNTQLLLIKMAQLNSILAEYHRTNDGRHHHSYRNRLTVKQGGMASKASMKFRNMKKFSKSLASLTTINQSNSSKYDLNGDDDDNDDDGNNTSHQRNLVKTLNEKQSTSSSKSLCRIPLDYEKFFELLNESGEAAEPCHRLIDLISLKSNQEDLDNRIDKWPHGFYLRTPCRAYTQKNHSESHSDHHSNSTASNDSCYGSSSDLELHKNFITLNDDVHMLQAGEMLCIVGECLARHARLSDVNQPSSSPIPASSSYSSPVTWFRDKSKGFFLKKTRLSSSAETGSNEKNRTKSITTKLESYLKCENQHKAIFYIPLSETGLFSPLNFQSYSSKIDIEFTRNNLAEVFQLKNLVSSFRLPISVRHLDGTVFFDNPYLPATIQRHEPPTKLRLLMPYTEDVVFACLINISTSKLPKNSSPCIVFPLSVNADIEIQPCGNMNDISQTDEFYKLISVCSQSIERYLTDISLVHFPIQVVSNPNRRKPPLYKKRSQSESFIDFSEDEIKPKFRHSHEQLNSIDDSLSSAPSPLRYRDSIETLKQKGSIGSEQSNIRCSGRYSKMKSDKQKRYSTCDYTSEDEIYEDVDKIYDYIRLGDVTGDVKKIQAKEITYHNPHQNATPNSNSRISDLNSSALSHSPGKMITHRFNSQIDKSRNVDDEFDYQSCRNVDDDQAHALFLASKQRTKPNSQDSPDSKPITKMKRYSKH